MHSVAAFAEDMAERVGSVASSVLGAVGEVITYNRIDAGYRETLSGMDADINATLTLLSSLR